MAFGAALIKEGISVTTIGVGTDYNEDLMTRLSQRSDGNSYFVESSPDLPQIFRTELGDVLSVVARKVKVMIKCPDGVRPLNIIGREGRIREHSAELFFKPALREPGKICSFRGGNLRRQEW